MTASENNRRALRLHDYPRRPETAQRGNRDVERVRAVDAARSGRRPMIACLLASLRGFVARRRIDGEILLRLFLRQGLIVVAIGIGVGLAGAVAAGKSLASLVFGVSVTDPLTLATAATLLVTVGLLACIVPARSATRLDSMTALRTE